MLPKQRRYVKLHAILDKNLVSTYSSKTLSSLTLHLETVTFIVKELIYKTASKTVINSLDRNIIMINKIAQGDVNIFSQLVCFFNF